MATTKHTITPAEGWKNVASSTAKNVLIENTTMYPCYMYFNAAGAGAPADTVDAFHRIEGKNTYERVSLNTDVYIRASDEYPSSDVTVVVSTD